MPTVPEFLEFFIRATKVPTGTRKDQETGFAIEYQVYDCNMNPIAKKNRFLKDHFPSEAVFKKLFASVAFRLNPEHTASTDQQGLVRIAIGSNVVNRLDSETNANGDVFTTIVVPSELPTLTAGANVTITPRIKRSSDGVIVGSILAGDRLKYYVDYLIAATPSAGTDNVNNQTNTELKIANTSSIDPADPNWLDILTHTLTTALSSNGDTLEYDWYVDNKEPNNTGALEMWVGNQTATDDNEYIALWQAGSPIGVDFTVHINLKLIRTGANGVLIIALIKVGQSSVGVTSTNLGTAETKATTGDSNLESAVVIRHHIPNSPVINWAVGMKIMFRVDKGVSLIGTMLDTHTIIGRSIING